MAANRLEGEVEITLDKRRILKLTMRARALFSQQTGISVDKFVRLMSVDLTEGNTPRNDYLAALLWACLVHEDRLLTLEQAENLPTYAVGESDSEKQMVVVTKLIEIWNLRQGVDPKELEKKSEAGGTEAPPAQIETLRSPNA